MSVPTGSIVTYQCKTHTTHFTSAADVETAIASDILTAGLIVQDFSLDTPSLLTEILNASTISTFAFGMTLHVQTSIDYNSPDDIKGIIDHYVFIETGDLPGASSIPYVNVPGGSNLPTGQISQIANAGGQANPAPASAWSQFWLNLEAKGGMVLGLVALGIIGAFVLITMPRKAF